MDNNNKLLLLSLITLILVFIYVIYWYIVKYNSNNINQINTKEITSNDKKEKEIEKFSELNKEYNSNKLFSEIKNNKLDFKDYILLDNIIEYIDNKLNDSNGIINKINSIKSKIKNIKNNPPLDFLPVGTIMMWNSNNLPLDKNGNESSNWVWCNGDKGTPNFNNALPLGDNLGTNRLSEEEVNKIVDGDNIKKSKISKNNIPEHSHTANVSNSGHKHNISEKKTEAYPVVQYRSWAKYITQIIGPGRAIPPHDKYPTRKFIFKHTHTMSEDGGHSHNEVKTTIGREYGVNDNEQIDFYPRIASINFIMKIK